MSANLTTPPALPLNDDTILSLLRNGSINNPIPEPSLDAAEILVNVFSIPSKESSSPSMPHGGGMPGMM